MSSASERPSVNQADLDVVFHRHVCRAWVAGIECHECDELDAIWLAAMRREAGR